MLVQKENKLDSLEKISKKNKWSFQNGEEWLYASQYQYKFGEFEDVLQKGKTHTYEDSSTLVYTKILDMAHKGTIAPLDIVAVQIYKMLLNQKSKKYLDKIKTKIYKDAEKYKRFEIYTKKP